MLTILTTTETYPIAQKAIGSIDRLAELVRIVTHVDDIHDLKTLVIDQHQIAIPLDWFDSEPPYIFPKVALSHEHLLALVFYRLGNHQKAFEFLSPDMPLYQHLLIATHLHFGYDITKEMLSFCHQTCLHNYLMLHYYGSVEHRIASQALRGLFAEEIANAANDELKVFTAKHYINLLLDVQQWSEAKYLAESQIEIAISDDAKFAMKRQLAAISMAQLQVPYAPQELAAIQDLQLAVIAYYESKNLTVLAGLLLIEAAEVANFKQDYILSKDLINKAIKYFKEEDIPAFLGEAGFKKAVLLYTWSKNGSPQYYKASINAFQDVLKVFKRDTHPQKFADIHHNLALIYSEIPVSSEEKPMWVAFCASSFKEALAYYSKETHPYEYAMVSHNYATALMHFPPAKIHDNLAKAQHYFQEALQVRTANAYPFERALTLLNELELGWLTHNENSQKELEKYENMKSKAKEVIALVQDQNLIAQAQAHLEELEKVGILIHQ